MSNQSGYSLSKASSSKRLPNMLLQDVFTRCRRDFQRGMPSYKLPCNSTSTVLEEFQCYSIYSRRKLSRRTRICWILPQWTEGSDKKGFYSQKWNLPECGGTQCAA
ncbi:hypothetical protein EPR50_G00093500 [Perca flavescens]|uniref:Uncharacterized protein n=1 Tax=Perca flavescens TaxID=8167 RepID=A0A484CZI9_PERFV|nr:hypothetical protein EPR50_G00093500 [Perca flavescens]